MNGQNMVKGINSVERFDIRCDRDDVLEDPAHGPWVRYDDVKNLQQQLAAAREALQMAESDAASRVLAALKIVRSQVNSEWNEPLSHMTLRRIDDVIAKAMSDATLQRDRQL